MTSADLLVQDEILSALFAYYNFSKRKYQAAIVGTLDLKELIEAVEQERAIVRLNVIKLVKRGFVENVNGNGDYRITTNGIDAFREKIIRYEQADLKNTEDLNNASLRASNATEKLALNQIDFNDKTKDYNRKIRNLTRATVAFVLLQFAIAVYQVYLSTTINDTSYRQLQLDSLQGLQPQQMIIVGLPMDLQERQKTLKGNDTVYVKILPPKKKR